MFSLLCLASIAQPCNPQSTANGSPCSQQTPATAFCADENPYGVTYPSSTNSPNSSPFTGDNHVNCCFTTPNPAWYYFQIDESGTLTIHIEQHSLTGGTLDVDFVCWGPFTAASQADFTNNLCCGAYNISSTNSSNVVDCSYSASWTEDCSLGNVQAGQWYLLLLTNYSNQPGTITFNSTSNSTATTNCDLLNSGDSNSPVCEGGTLELYVTAPQSGATYNWTGPNGFAQSTTSTTLQVPNVTANMSGEYHMTMSGISQNSNEAVVDVYIYPRPAPEIVAEDESLCMGESTSLSVNCNFELTWFAETFSGSSSSKIAEYVSTVTVTPTESTHYILKADNDGCIGRDTIDIIVNPNPVIGITITDPTLCYGDGTNITATGGTYYNWSNGSTSSTIHVSPDQTTTYTLQVKTEALCSADTTMEIIVYPELTSSFNVQPSHCGQATGEITMTTTGGMGQYTYTAPGATFNDNVASNLHEGTYSITITDSVGCHISRVAEISSIPGPTPCFIFATSDDVNMVITNCTQGNNTYFWDFGDGVTSTETHPIHEYMDPGRYSVNMIVMDEHNCIDSMHQDYVINGPVYIPNAFSPNGDGINDEIFIIGKTIQKEEFLWVIYDRHGALVFMSIDPTISWDGTIHAGKNKIKDASPGVYVYHLKYKDVNGNHFERDGSITLIR